MTISSLPYSFFTPFKHIRNNMEFYNETVRITRELTLKKKK